MGHKDYIRVLQALRGRGRFRFSELEALLGLNPLQLDRALKFLRGGGFLNMQTRSPGKHKRKITYSIAGRGEAFLQAFLAFTGDLYRRRRALGVAEVAEFRAQYVPAASRKAAPAGNIDRMVKIGPLLQSGAATARTYRGACLRLSPIQRIARMRAHSRRMILLNPANPRSPHIERNVVRIAHDVF